MTFGGIPTLEDFQGILWWKLEEIRVCVYKFFKNNKQDESYLTEALDTLNEIDGALESLKNKA